jgi:hypothetical protein
MNKKHIAILSFVIALTIILLIVPVSAKQYVTTTADGKYSNPYPDKEYGEQFRSAERPHGLGFGIAELYGDADLGNISEFHWLFSVFLTDEQMDQYYEWEFNDWDMPLIDALTQLVPEQVSALPDDLVRYLRDHPYITVGHDPIWDTAGWHYNSLEDTWTDPCGTNIPQELLPRAIYPGDDPGVVLCAGTTNEDYLYIFTPEVQSHLANLGLATDRRSLDPEFSTSVQNGAYIVTFEANTLQGERVSWTLIHKSDGSWTDAATGEEISYDLHYVLAAFGFASSPNYTSPPVFAEIAAKASSVGSVGSIDVAARSKTLSSPSSNTIANILLSQAGTSKISKVNINSFAATRTTTTSSASTASLVSQATVSSTGETTPGRNFDMASFAATYQSGGAAIASRSFGSEVLAARGIGG